MAKRLLVLVATGKGAFILESNQGRQDWTVHGPLCDAQPTNHLVADPETGTIWAGGGDAWRGAAVWRSTDQGATFEKFTDGLAYPEAHDKIKAVWSLAHAHGRLLTGAEPAGLFESRDDGETW
ncbi:MAG TPA: exo-alpha-sialidase, partial [Geminicoccaceae bacterium]|nr:exo-alpha-sialidase [Geminicoccaceae bacterium]